MFKWVTVISGNVVYREMLPVGFFILGGGGGTAHGDACSVTLKKLRIKPARSFQQQ
jgi:hypothetical protein